MSGIDLYLDLDGVILRRTGSSEFNGRVVFDVAPGAFEFLKWATENFHCFWLTSRSHDGTYDEIERGLPVRHPDEQDGSRDEGSDPGHPPSPLGRREGQWHRPVQRLLLD